MKVSQIVAVSATLIFQAQACVRIRVDRVVKDGYGLIQDLKLYDNDNPVKTLPFPINFSASDEDTTLRLNDYAVTLQYKDRSYHPYGGRLTYPKGRKFAASKSRRLSLIACSADRDIQGKNYTTYEDAKGKHDVYCFSDNYDNCGSYTCGV